MLDALRDDFFKIMQSNAAWFFDRSFFSSKQTHTNSKVITIVSKLYPKIRYIQREKNIF